MSDGLDLVVGDDASPALRRAADGLRLDLADAAHALADALLAAARDDASGAVLAVRTGAYRAGLSTEVTAGRDGVEAVLRAAAPTAVILEYGAAIPAHDIAASAAQALRFAGSAGAVYAKTIRFPGATIAPHPVLHDALEALGGRVVDTLEAAAERFVRDAS